jgi:hypothetical protein
VRPCIVSEDGDQITVDETHSAYPRAPKPGFAPPKLADAPGVSFIDKVKNFTKAAVNHVTAGMPTCSDEEIGRRYAICQGCEFFKDGSCGKCGCPVVRERQYISKLSWAREKCPVGKWGPVDGQTQDARDTP